MERFRKLAGTPGSDGMNTCPTVLEVADDPDNLVIQGKKLTAADRQALNIPDDEDAVVIPRDLYLRGAARMTEDG